MKYAALCVIALATLIPLTTSAQEYVQGYTRRDGTYVQGYYRSSPNATREDNYSTRGNVNPYTGQAGTRSPEPNPYQTVQPMRAYQPIQPLQPLPNPYATPAPLPNPYGNGNGNDDN